jgi:hypothetical protein
MIAFSICQPGEAYPFPAGAIMGDIITKLRYFTPGEPRRVKHVALVAGIPSDEELRQARISAIEDGAEDLDMVVLHRSWSPLFKDEARAWIPAREFPAMRTDPQRQPALMDWPEG